MFLKHFPVEHRNPFSRIDYVLQSSNASYASTSFARLATIIIPPWLSTKFRAARSRMFLGRPIAPVHGFFSQFRTTRYREIGKLRGNMYPGSTSWSTAEWSDPWVNSLPLKKSAGKIRRVLNTLFTFICLYNVYYFIKFATLSQADSQSLLQSLFSSPFFPFADPFLRFNSSSRIVRPIRPSEFSGTKASAVEKSGTGRISSITITIVRHNNLPFDETLHWNYFREIWTIDNQSQIWLIIRIAMSR